MPRLSGTVRAADSGTTARCHDPCCAKNLHLGTCIHFRWNPPAAIFEPTPKAERLPLSLQGRTQPVSSVHDDIFRTISMDFFRKNFDPQMAEIDFFSQRVDPPRFHTSIKYLENIGVRAFFPGKWISVFRFLGVSS